MSAFKQVVWFAVFAFTAANAEEPLSFPDKSFRQIKAFVDAAPKATAKRDLAYAVKIGERDRIWACHKCKELLTIDPKNKDALGLYCKLQMGEGPSEAIASYTNPGVDLSRQIEDRRIHEVLSAHLIQSVGAGSLGISVNVSSSQAARARALLARVILNEKLQITLTKSVEGGTRWVEVKPEDAIREYSDE